jgi:hypothetical protein
MKREEDSPQRHKEHKEGHEEAVFLVSLFVLFVPFVVNPPFQIARAIDASVRR